MYSQTDEVEVFLFSIEEMNFTSIGDVFQKNLWHLQVMDTVRIYGSTALSWVPYVGHTGQGSSKALEMGTFATQGM